MSKESLTSVLTLELGDGVSIEGNSLIATSIMSNTELATD